MMSRSLPLTSPPRLDNVTAITTTSEEAAAATTTTTTTTTTRSSTNASASTLSPSKKHHRRSASASSNATASAPSSTTNAGVNGNNTIRRLSDDDVRTVFECLHHRQHLPCRLHFTIVKVGPNGLKLSPPSYEFADGLYVLLRPPKKPKAGQPVEMPSPPAHLHHLVAGDDWEETCPWSLSGPQFPQPTAIQQRYCYPKGPPEYSSRVGGALWTMYGANGKEDLEFRLLHVYYSAKRAVNKGFAVPPPPMPKAKNTMPYSTPSPQRRSRAVQQKKKVQQQTTTQQQQQQQQFPMSAPALPHSASGICHSPLSIDWSMTPSSMPPSCSRSSLGSGNYNHNTSNNNSNDPTNLVVTPYCSDLFRRRRPTGGGSASASTMLSTPTFSTPSPIRKRGRMSYDESEQASTTFSSTKSLDALDMESSLHDIESYWNDPLMNIFMQPSHEAPFTPSTAMTTTSGSSVTNNILTATAAGTNPTVALSYSSSSSSSSPHSPHPGAMMPPLSHRLTKLHDKLREIVADDDDAATVVHDWAEGVANEFNQGKVQL